VIIEKPLSALTETDLRDLVSEQVAESESIDYKLEMYGSTDGEKKEMLHDVSAMANARGGHLLIGIREENEVPVELIGISDAELAAERILNSCHAGIHERISGLNARPIPLSNGRSVLAVYVPVSTRIPHMVIFQQEDRCWIRHGRQKMKMSIEEIREACSRVDRLFEDVETFLSKQSERASSLAVRNPGTPILRIGLTPLDIRREKLDLSRVDLRSLMKDPPRTRPSGHFIHWPLGTEPEPTIRGLQISCQNLETLELFQNGYSEYRRGLIGGGLTEQIETGHGSRIEVFNDLAVVEVTVSFMRFCEALLERTGLVGPFVLTWEIRNVRGRGLTGRPMFTDSLPRPRSVLAPRSWQEREGPDIILPSRQTGDFEFPSRIAKVFLDHLWQSFGFEKAPYFDQHSEFAPP
jgi:hypothetical protein